MNNLVICKTQIFCIYKSLYQNMQSNVINAHITLVRLIDDNPYTIEEIIKGAVMK